MAPDNARLTPKLRALVVTDSLNLPPIGRLTAAQADVLAAVATRRQRFDEPVKPHRAIHALAVGARAEVATPVLEEVLGGRRAPVTDRVVAARELGRIATPAAEAVLLRQVRDREPQVQRAVFDALGMSAGAPALRRLTDLVQPHDRAARRQLELTRALIAHRNGLDGPFLAEVPGVQRRPARGAKTTPVTMRMLSAKATVDARERLQGSSYGIALADRALALTAGRSDSMIFLNAELGTSPAGVRRLFDRPWIAAILGRSYVDREGATPRYLLLTRPAGRTARIEVVRTDGEVVYVGTVAPNDTGVAFDLTDVDRPGTTPLHLAGRLTGRGVDLDVAVSFAARLPARATEPVAFG